jgi:hypothetical protein
MGHSRYKKQLVRGSSDSLAVTFEIRKVERSGQVGSVGREVDSVAASQR